MKITEIEDRYSVLKLKGEYHLFDLNRKGRFNNKYTCTLIKRGDYFKIKNADTPGTSKVDILLEYIDTYLKLLPYDSEYYCPLLKDGSFEHFIIHDYLDSLGFEECGFDETYILKMKNVYNYTSSKIKITLDGLSSMGSSFRTINDEIPEDVKIILWTGDYSCIRTTVRREVEEIKKGIDSILKPLLVSDSINSYNKAEELKNHTDIDLTLEKLSTGLNIASTDYKKELKNKLLELVNSIKE